MEAVSSATNKLEIEQVTDANNETCCTFIMHGEDHTLGNALKYIISKNPEVEFCGYSIPHPAEKKLNLRIQTRGASATEVLRNGLEDLNSVCEHALTTFETAVADFRSNSENEEAVK